MHGQATRTHIRKGAVLVAAALLAACGGDSTSPDTGGTGGTGGTSKPAAPTNVAAVCGNQKISLS